MLALVPRLPGAREDSGSPRGSPVPSVTLGSDSGPFSLLLSGGISRYFHESRAEAASPSPFLPPSLLPALPPHVSYSGFGAKSLLAEVEDSLGLG